jgi:PelA/Pel-15E family pectate lyase
MAIMRFWKLSLVLVLPLHAAVIGTSKPAMPLTVARINAELPAGERKAWLDYVHRSEVQMAADRAALGAEREGMTDVPPLPKQGFSGRAIPLHREAEFYKSAEARRIGDVILSFQIASGGWSKNLAMDAPRLKGQIYATSNLPPTAQPDDDFDKPLNEKWHYMGTLDNDATNTEIHFLAELSAAFPGKDGDAYRASVLRGIEYLLKSQMPNGGWPQVWPLEGGYHDAITFNDDAVTESAEVLTLAMGNKSDAKPAEDYSFVPAAVRVRAKVAVAKALECILATQVRIPSPEGKGTVLTVWAQQHDPLTLKPASARNYEPEALASGESASVLEYLMSLPHPTPAEVRAVNAAAAWFEAHKIMGFSYAGGRGTPGGRKLTAAPGAGPIWSRYYSLTTGKPIFGDRDKTIHDDVMELSLERRNGYGWYGDGPAKALAEYAEWKKLHP